MLRSEKKPAAKLSEALYGRVCQIPESARASVARSVNTAQVVANWLVGREIVEEEQQGRNRAGYAERLVATLSVQLSADYGAGCSAQNLPYMKQFYLAYPELLQDSGIFHAVRGKLEGWRPGQLHPGLSWTHYRTLLRVDRKPARAFYEIEAARHAWSARELERQINSLLFERLAKSRDKRGLMKLSSQGQTVSLPVDVCWFSVKWREGALR